MTDVTRILDAINAGEPKAAEELLPLVYDELRRLAAQKLAQEKSGQTLDATALVHEAYLRLVGPGDIPQWDHRGHFFAAAAEAMRRILVENARRKRRKRHGGGLERVDLNGVEPVAPELDENVLELADALEKLARHDATKAELVKLRFFAGLTQAEAAGMLGISTSTADRHWAFARAWLHQEIHRDQS